MFSGVDCIVGLECVIRLGYICTCLYSTVKFKGVSYGQVYMVGFKCLIGCVI